MDINNLEIKIPKEIVPYICTIKDGDTISDKANLFLVLGLFASKAVTLEKAAELAKKSVWDFMEILKEYNICWGEYTEEEVTMDDISIKKIMGEFYG